MTPIRRWLDQRSHSSIMAIAALGIVLLAAIDAQTGEELSFSIFYLAPVALAAWYAGDWPGLGVSLTCAATWMAADRLAGAEYSHPLIPVWNAVVRLGFFAITALLLVRLRRALQFQRTLAATDALTGIANSRTFYTAASGELDRARRYLRPFTLAYIDLDNFKTVNDRSGHEAGDAALRSVAGVIRHHLRATDLVARLGGDEFAVLLPETGRDAAGMALGKLHASLMKEATNQGWPITFSIGVVTVTSPPSSIDELVSAADRLMYAVKRTTKNAIRHETV